MRTAIYMRRSSQDKDEKQIHSIPRQWGEIEKFIIRYNDTVEKEKRLEFMKEDIFQEDASAKGPGRGEFGRMVELIKRNKYDTLLCFDLTRLSRNSIDTGALTYLLDEGKIIEIRTVDGKVFTGLPTDKFTFSLFLAVAKYENDQKGIFVSSGMNKKAVDGGTPNKARLGYLNAGDKKGDKWIDTDEENDNFKRLQKLWRLFATGAYRESDIYKMGCDQGITIISRKGRVCPNESTYRNMFTSKYYLGQVTARNKETGEKVWHEGKHEAMVDQETFDQVQQILQKHGFKHSKPNEEPSYDNLLRELLICGKSGKPMYIDSKARYTCSFCKNRFYSAEIKKCTKCTRKLEQKAIDSVYKVRYYMCYTGFEHTFIIDGKKKKSRSISSEYIESLVDAELSKLYISDGLFEVLKKRLHFLWDEKNSEINEKKKRVRKDIDKFDEDISRIMEKKWKTLDMSEKSEDEVNEVIEEKRQRISILEKELRGIREQTEEEFDRTWEALNVLLRAKTVFGKDGSNSFEPKRHLLLSLCSNLKFMDGKLIVGWKKPFDIASSVGLTKKNPQSKSEDSSLESKWLPNPEDVRTIFMNHAGHIHIPFLSPVGETCS